jgi:hypothetical protein
MRSMPVLRFLAFLAIAWAALSPTAGAAEPREGQGVRVGLVLDARIAAAIRNVPAMIAEAAAVWRPYGVSVMPQTPSTIEPGDVLLTLRFEALGEQRTTAGQPRRGASESGEGLGAIWFDENGLPMPAIVVDPDAVGARLRHAVVAGRSLDTWPLATADLITARALGRVLAHEIGHYLLASPAHARKGLMRAAFDGRRLAEWDRGGFALERLALPRLRARLARLASAQKPVVAAGPAAIP